MRLRKKKKAKEAFVRRIGSREIKMDESEQEIEGQIWAREREISRLNNEQIDALPDNEFDELYAKAVESGSGK